MLFFLMEDASIHQLTTNISSSRSCKPLTRQQKSFSFFPSVLFSENLLIFSQLIQHLHPSIWRMPDVLCVHHAHTVLEGTSPVLWLRPRTLWRCSPWYTWLPPSSPLHFPRWEGQRQKTMWFCVHARQNFDVNQSSRATISMRLLRHRYACCVVERSAYVIACPFCFSND